MGRACRAEQYSSIEYEVCVFSCRLSVIRGLYLISVVRECAFVNNEHLNGDGRRTSRTTITDLHKLSRLYCWERERERLASLKNCYRSEDTRLLSCFSQLEMWTCSQLAVVLYWCRILKPMLLFFTPFTIIASLINNGIKWIIILDQHQDQTNFSETCFCWSS